MRKARLIASIGMLGLIASACSGYSVVPEQTEVLVTFDAGTAELPEGVAVDPDGNVFASLSPLGQLVKIDPAADPVVAAPFGAVDGLNEGDFGLIGITTDDDGNVYGGVFSTNEAAHGVWRFDADDGEATKLEGTEKIAFPNAVAVDDDTVYISDTIGPDGAGAIWRVTDGPAEIWAQDPLLAGDGSAQFGFPIGANGIDVHDGKVYVGITETFLVVTVTINDDGSAGETSTFADLSSAGPDDSAVLVDGIDVGSDGSVYVAAPGIHSVLQVSDDGRTVNTIATATDKLDAPTSVALGDGVLYVVSFSAALGPLSNGTGPSVVHIPV